MMISTVAMGSPVMMSILLVTVLAANIPTVNSAKSPFISREEAHDILSTPDMGHYKVLTTKLNMRSDDLDGWEELPHENYDSRAERLESAIISSDLPFLEKRALLDKLVIGSTIGLNSLR